MKKILYKILALCCVIFTMFSLISCNKENNLGSTNDDQAIANEEQTMTSEQKFYEVVDETRILLDEVADDIYSCWYDAIYNDEYYGSINIAIAYAQSINKENLDTIALNDETITAFYKEVKDGALSKEVKEVLHTYSDYYEFVVNVSGSFNSFSAGKESKKKALATALKNLSYEL